MQFKHKEAFCIMQYQNQRTKEIEKLWNSRDGVTPFMILSKDKKDDMIHINWGQDKIDPHFDPPIGSRIFMDLTEERARESVQKRIDNFWDRKAFGKSMKDHYGTKENAFNKLMEGMKEEIERKQPMIVVVDQNIKDLFAARPRFKAPLKSRFA